MMNKRHTVRKVNASILVICKFVCCVSVPDLHAELVVDVHVDLDDKKALNERHYTRDTKYTLI